MQCYSNLGHHSLSRLEALNLESLSKGGLRRTDLYFLFAKSRSVLIRLHFLVPEQLTSHTFSTPEYAFRTYICYIHFKQISNSWIDVFAKSILSENKTLPKVSHIYIFRVDLKRSTNFQPNLIQFFEKKYWNKCLTTPCCIFFNFFSM